MTTTMAVTLADVKTCQLCWFSILLKVSAEMQVKNWAKYKR